MSVGWPWAPFDPFQPLLREDIWRETGDRREVKYLGHYVLQRPSQGVFVGARLPVVVGDDEGRVSDSTLLAASARTSSPALALQ